MKFTIMAYNIERGFHSIDHVLEINRMEAAQRAVREVNPDILVLTEACYGEKNSHSILMDYKKIFDFPYSHFSAFTTFGPRGGDEGGNCLLSHFPLEAESIELNYKSAIRGKITIENKVLTLDVVHPSPSVDDQEKIKTLRPLLESYQRPYIIAGDFNTVHPNDECNWKEIEEQLHSYTNPEKVKWFLENWQRAELVSWILGRGLKDAFPVSRREMTVPTPAAYEKATSGVRIDFFFRSPDVIVRDAYVLKNSDTEIASDHYPIVGIFEL